MRLAGLIGIGMVVGMASASPLETAIFHRDIDTLDRLATSADANEARLAQGAALALRHHDDAARTALEPLMVVPTVRAGACFALADVYLRQTLYAKAAAALDCVEQAGQALTGEPAQIRADARALADAPAMVVEHPASGTLALHRDHAGLLRIPVTINGERLKAVIDSDASFSVVSRSTADMLGLRVLPQQLAIVTTSRPDQPMHLAIADRVQLGDAELRHVVFAVLPDGAVRFGPDYRMEAVVGLPVLVALHRIAVNADADRLDFGGASVRCTPNLILTGLDPFVVVSAGGGTLRLALDTAADTSSLNATALDAVPALAAGARPATISWQGVGGAVTDRKARRLDTFALTIGDWPLTLQRVAVLSQAEDDRHGLIGLDAFKGPWSLDFEAMCVRLDN